MNFASLNRLFDKGLGYGLRVLILSLALIINQIPVGLIILMIGSLYTVIVRSLKFKKILKSKS